MSPDQPRRDKAPKEDEPSNVLKAPAEKRDEGTVMDPEINLRDRAPRATETEEETSE